ncbi:MAG: carbohydrate ABC transporter permease [Clostridia bacterium]|nr:carbohydrate ABC transporter permease [Clostridia bacterium]
MKNPFKNISEADRLRALKYTKVGGSVVYAIFRFLLLMSIGFIIIYPLLYMIVTTISAPTTFTNGTRVWIPTEFAIKDNFGKAFYALDYIDAFFNTIKYEVVSALLSVASCAVIGYGFARFNFKGKKILTGILFLTILMPDMLLLVPRSVNFTNIDFLYIGHGIEALVNWIGSLFGADWSGFNVTPDISDSLLTMWLPSVLGIGLRSGVLIYIYIQFFTGLPRELEEAAWVDGAGPFKTFLRIAVPSSSVVFITVSVFSLIWHWNDSLLAGIYLRTDSTLAVTLGDIDNFLNAIYTLAHGTPQYASAIMAACLLFITPMLIFYMIVQRGFVESIDRVGITG